MNWSVALKYVECCYAVQVCPSAIAQDKLATEA